MATMLRADEIRWALDDPEQPAACHVAEDVGPPLGLTASRADLVTWWRWRYSTLQAENARVGDLLVEALTDAQAYREVTLAALDALGHATGTAARQRQTIARLRDELRRREPVRGTAA